MNTIFVKYVYGKYLFFITHSGSCELPLLSAFAVGKSAALFVICMNADLWPLHWPLQPPCKFTGGSETPCASSDTVLMEAPNPISSNFGVRHKHIRLKQIYKTWPGCVDASSPNISWWTSAEYWVNFKEAVVTDQCLLHFEMWMKSKLICGYL